MSITTARYSARQCASLWGKRRDSSPTAVQSVQAAAAELRSAGQPRAAVPTLRFCMNTVGVKVIVLMGACLLLASCAQTGPPLPPSLELPKPPSDLRASRKGNAVTLTWSEPTLTTDRQSVRFLGSTRICRSTEADMPECGDPAGEVVAPRERPPRDGEAG